MWCGPAVKYSPRLFTRSHILPRTTGAGMKGSGGNGNPGSGQPWSLLTRAASFSCDGPSPSRSGVSSTIYPLRRLAKRARAHLRYHPRIERLETPAPSQQRIVRAPLQEGQAISMGEHMAGAKKSTERKSAKSGRRTNLHLNEMKRTRRVHQIVVMEVARE